MEFSLKTRDIRFPQISMTYDADFSVDFIWKKFPDVKTFIRLSLRNNDIIMRK